MSGWSPRAGGSSGGLDRSAVDLAGLVVGVVGGFALLPLRLASVGLSMVQQTLAQLETGGSVPTVSSPAAFVAPPPVPASAWPAPPSYPPGASGAVSASNPATVGGAGVPASVHAGTTTTPKEDRTMDDRNLSGRELKLVEYSIVSVKPELKDDERLLTGPTLIAFTDEMIGEDFVTWIVAAFLQTDEGVSLEVQHSDKKYLRVCWHVKCRFAIEDTDYQEKQADYLKDISESLRRKHGHDDHDEDDDSGSGGGPAGKARRGGK